jgi:hypothetical protein
MADQDSRDRFERWSSNGSAHPASPAGGGGPGFFRLPGSAQGSPFSSLPSVQSPAGRLFDWSAALTNAEPTVPRKQTAEEVPISGKAPASLGLGSMIRIPVPGTKGLAIEFSPRGWTPKSGSTSSLFIQDLTGKRHLRLDYGFNKNSGTVEWHWNQKGVANTFGITNHATAGPGEKALGTAAGYYKYAGRTLLVVGIIADGYSIVVSSNPLRRTVQVVSAWAAASAGCQVVGAGGAAAGTAVTPGLGTAIGGVVGCAVGSFIGYCAAETAAGYVYDWAEGTTFTQISPSAAPDDFAGAGGSFGGGGASGGW